MSTASPASWSAPNAFPPVLQTVQFFGIREERPGGRWQGLFEATWPAYRAWYLREGDTARPSLAEAERMLRRHMPELLTSWEGLVGLTGGDETAARLLSLWNPPAFLPACSQAVLLAGSPVLVRNYDYRPELCERVVWSSALTGRRVLGMSDCLWGLLDGMNDAGFAASLAFGGRPGAGPGFGIPLVMRYLLEMAESVADAEDLLSGLPVSMSYNITVLDRTGRAGTIFVAPGTRAEFRADVVATNHRGRVPEFPEHARRFRSLERQQWLLHEVAGDHDAESFIAQFMSPPLYNTAYDRGFGTTYTAAYRPEEGFADYLWPGTTWRRAFESPDEIVTVVLGGDGTADEASRRLTGAAPGREPS